MSMKWDRIVIGDCRSVLPGLPAGCADLVIADPPYNIGYKYDVHDDNMTSDEYIEFSSEWFRAVRRVLKPTGSFYLVIGDEYAAELKIGIDKYFTLRNWIIWKYGFGQNTTKKFARCHAHILYYVADPKRFTFNARDVRMPSDRATKYNDRRAAPGGKTPPDVWEFPRLAGTFHERTGHPCQLPSAMVERMVRASSNRGDLVLDPFIGSGTTPVAAKRNGRRYYGVELSPDYAAAARLRVKNVGIVANLTG